MHTPEAVFLKSLMDWVEAQKKILNAFKEADKELENADRLMQVLASRNACFHIARTIKGFESWLQNPLVIGLMPKEMADEVRRKLWDLMKEVMEFDIKHTSDFTNLLKKMSDEGKLPRVLFEKREEARRVPYTL
ncbi:MAG: DUF2153 family protein [Candidatus Nezhaarchaeales archaeon]